MKHFKAEEWVDFVNRATSPEQMEAIQKHLAAGCEKLAKHVALRRKARSFATAESAYLPPEQAVQEAALFGPARGAGCRNDESRVIEVLFDSFLQPVFSGARAAYTGIRHMLYRAGPFQIDLQIEAAKPGHDRMVVTGQVLDVGRPEIFGSGLHVALSNRFGNPVHELTNEFGEFRVEIKNSDDLELSLHYDPEKPIVITLKDPLGGLAWR